MRARCTKRTSLRTRDSAPGRACYPLAGSWNCFWRGKVVKGKGRSFREWRVACQSLGSSPSFLGKPVANDHIVTLHVALRGKVCRKAGAVGSNEKGYSQNEEAKVNKREASPTGREVEEISKFPFSHSHSRVWSALPAASALTRGTGATAAVFPEIVSCLAPGGPRIAERCPYSPCQLPPSIS